jgi:hypothetical protein
LLTAFILLNRAGGEAYIAAEIHPLTFRHFSPGIEEGGSAFSLSIEL